MASDIGKDLHALIYSLRIQCPHYNRALGDVAEELERIKRYKASERDEIIAGLSEWVREWVLDPHSAWLIIEGNNGCEPEDMFERVFCAWCHGELNRHNEMKRKIY